jgi:hypothetical protein
MDIPTHAETLFITDAAINIFRDLGAKRDIVQNAIDLFTQIGLGTPRSPSGRRQGSASRSSSSSDGKHLRNIRPSGSRV